MIWRHLRALGTACEVVAPSSIPKRPGERVKTDRRDALMLARLSRSGDLTAVRVPGAADEAVRDLVRAHEDAVRECRSARHRLKALLLRNGIGYAGKTGVGRELKLGQREDARSHSSENGVRHALPNSSLSTTVSRYAGC